MKKKFIYIPFLFLLLVFFADKIFTLDFFQTSFYQEGNPVYYAQRKHLFQRMRSDSSLGKKELALAFGDSRAYPYSSKTLPSDIAENWTVYNFSGPQAVPAYGFYWFQKILEAGIKPKVVFYVISPEGFDDSKGLLYDPFLRLGADDPFIAKYWGRFSTGDRFDIIKQKLFSIRKVKPGFKLFWNRLTSDKLNLYSPESNHENLILELGNGEQLAYASASNNPSKLEKDALRLKSLYLSGFELGETEFFFVEEFLKLSKENGIKTYLIWPKVYPGYRVGYYELGLEKTWWPRIQELAMKYGASAADMNTLSACDTYYDASHQSVLCILEQSKILMDDFYGRKKLP
ncbi:DUF1574 domain-containing protein [Leptospira langatensis]|uniref:DUF1574 domain-containing protein n=1 Tax=Leptospira langatensis TaxID=2484983 RepID=A0A5F1ZPG3_9LEPT|nr:DUF1574 domain-containing protein [Leptospira langatensis]TGK05593.1 DUF1574 domain-containing protein [Leptospira langatensis]TGL38725.1 DUF1574 domain-containing protein [Leptospira langatensis]